MYKAEMQKVVYFTESTIAVIAKHYISFYKINCQLESTKFGCPGNACEEHFPKDFCFFFKEDVIFSTAESIQKKTHGDCELRVRKKLVK